MSKLRSNYRFIHFFVNHCCRLFNIFIAESRKVVIILKFIPYIPDISVGGGTIVAITASILIVSFRVAVGGNYKPLITLGSATISITGMTRSMEFF